MVAAVCNFYNALQKKRFLSTLPEFGTPPHTASAASAAFAACEAPQTLVSKKAEPGGAQPPSSPFTVPVSALPFAVGGPHFTRLLQIFVCAFMPVSYEVGPENRIH